MSRTATAARQAAVVVDVEPAGRQARLGEGRAQLGKGLAQQVRGPAGLCLEVHVHHAGLEAHAQLQATEVGGLELQRQLVAALAVVHETPESVDDLRGDRALDHAAAARRAGGRRAGGGGQALGRCRGDRVPGHRHLAGAACGGLVSGSAVAFGGV
jgi:hypothetical protein